MNTKEKIEVMQACESGAIIQFSENEGAIHWVDLGKSCALWHWGRFNYRVKPVEALETMEDRVKRLYGDFDVVMLVWDQDVLLIRRQLTETFNSECAHIEAQSMKGFYKYVYECKKTCGFYILSTPLGHGAAQHPIAGLFSRGEG